MRLFLVGADFEENLGLGMIAAAASGAGHEVEVRAFNQPGDATTLARAIAAAAPDVVGLGIQFQHRAHEFLALARRLRAEGYRGHVTAGGQFPTLAWREVLAPQHGVDSVVLHDGEETIADLLAALADGVDPARVAGLALRGPDGVPTRTGARRLCDDLDRLPFPRRYRPHTKHLGVPFIPIVGGRGCWGACSYCSITTFYRDARDHGGGRTVRMRSPENVAQEMALLWHAAGGDAIFCFHDDNFLLPRADDSLARARAIRAALDDLGVGRAGLVGKCRPECVTPALARELRALGVLRLYVGVENASAHGAQDLGRATQHPAIHAALEACREAGIFVCYNLLVFEPDATLDDVRENVRFIREHAHHPVNFCRAEPYHGTPLHHDLAARRSLSGSYLGWDYRLEDPRAELLFRVCAAAFRQRNFDPEGVSNRYMGLGYSLKLLEYFHDDPGDRRPALARRARDLTRAIALDTADFLDEAIDLVASTPLTAADALERETALLGLRVAAADRLWHEALDDLYADMSALASVARRPRHRLRPSGPVLQLAQKLGLGASLAVWATGLPGCSSTVDPVPADTGRVDTAPDSVVVDPAPVDSGVDTGVDVQVVDPAPVDSGMDTGVDIQVVDPPPPDSGMDTGRDIQIVDPPPPDAGREVGALESTAGPDAHRRLALIDQWRDTTPQRSERSRELPLWSPPQVSLAVCAAGDGARVRLVGGPDAITTRWESDGEVTGGGREVAWTPKDPTDQLQVAVRSRGGVTVLSLRARDIARRERADAEIREG